MAPVWLQGQTSVASPRVFGALSKAHGFPPVCSLVTHSVSVHPHATLLWLAFPSRSRSMGSTLDPETELSYFLYPHDLVSHLRYNALSVYARQWPDLPKT